MSRRLTAILVVALGAAAVWAALALATHNRYEVDKVTIQVDRPDRKITGKVFSSSTVHHFCTSGDWPVRLRLARPGKDKTVGFPTRTNFESRYRFTPPRSVKGKRVYAEVPSFPNSGHGYCVGDRTRAVRSP
jgi:hypothetical protein